MWFQIEDRGPVRWMVLDRPERKNAIPADGWEELGEAWARFESSGQRVLVVTGAGGDFCSGADLGPESGEVAGGVAAGRERMRLVGAAAAALHRVAKPTIAAVDGVAVGAGMNLALGCDVVVATDRARFSEIFVRRGLTVDFGGTWLLPRIVGLQRAKELALSGRFVGAAEALRLGLVTEVVTVAELETAVTQIAEGLATGAPFAQMLTKEAIDRSWALSFEEALDWEGQAQAVCLSTDDVAEGVAAFLERRAPRFRGR